jgi:hypothetical protein
MFERCVGKGKLWSELYSDRQYIMSW